MRILYVAPRYHTNQIPIMKTLCEHHHEVYFFSQFIGEMDEYVAVTPEIIGYSSIFNLYDYINKHWIHPNQESALNKRLLWGFPPVWKLNRRLKKIKPDIVIIRERSLYSIIVTLLCRMHHYKTILYNQTPLYTEVKKDLAHRIVNSLTPKVRMTPVMGKTKDGVSAEPNTVFVPFVMEVEKRENERSYLKDNVLHIFAVGKYEKRKNLQMLTEAVEQIKTGIPVFLTIAGEVCTKDNHDVYEKLSEYIKKHQLKNVKLLTNLSRTEMKEQYEKCDLFVIPSTREPASISQLEAMAYAVPVICSDTNGTACYVENGYNGYQFIDNDKKSLQECIELFAHDPEKVRKMGENSTHYLETNCQYENYMQGIKKCCSFL